MTQLCSRVSYIIADEFCNYIAGKSCYLYALDMPKIL